MLGRFFFLLVGTFFTVPLTALPANVTVYNPCFWGAGVCLITGQWHSQWGKAWGEYHECSPPPQQQQDQEVPSAFPGSLDQVCTNIFPFIAWVATEPEDEQDDSAEAVSKRCLVLFVILSVALLIIAVLYLLLFISCLYPYRCKTAYFLYVTALHRTVSSLSLPGFCHRTVVEEWQWQKLWEPNKSQQIHNITTLTILYKLDGCVKPSNVDIQLSNNSAVSSTVTDRAWCNAKDRGFICSEILVCVYVCV